MKTVTDVVLAQLKRLGHSKVEAQKIFSEYKNSEIAQDMAGKWNDKASEYPFGFCSFLGIMIDVLHGERE